MRAVKASAESTSGRMFESDFFEFFSRIPPWQPPAIFIPVIGWASYQSFAVGVGVLAFAGLFLAGALHWSLMEYWLHRMLFHFEASSPLGKRLIWIFHGVHHDWPNDKLRLVFPPGLSVPLAVVFWFLYSAVLGGELRYAAFAGLALGYLSYDMIHYYVHHFAPRNPIGKFLRRYHLAHHFKEPETGFGVSMPLWDFVFGTKPSRM
jgi:sterol desaturase/sphingolipid hydroxylase (fatty acid hydroxylase superfamily)